MFPLIYTLWVAGVITTSLAILSLNDLSFKTSLGAMLFGIVGAAIVFAIIALVDRAVYKHFLKKYLKDKRDDQEEVDSDRKQRSKIRWINRLAFWSQIATLLCVFLLGYIVLIGLPYILFGLTIDDVTAYFTETEAGQFMMIQMVSMLPMWLILPFIYFFAFYGPFVIKVLIFDTKTTLPGSAKFNVKREDIVGQDQVIDKVDGKLQNVRNRAQLRKYGKKPDRGVLLVGPPGTGKTLTLKYLAGKYLFPLIQVQSTIARQTFVGVSVIAMWIVQWRTTRIARKYDGAVVLFDEVDVIARSRDNVSGNQSFISRLVSQVPVFGGNDDSATVVLMTWMDGIDITSPIPYRFFRGIVNTFLDASFVDEFILMPLWNVIFALPLNTMLNTLRIPKKMRLPFIFEPPRVPAWQISGDDGVFFIGTTNRPHTLDMALRRENRFGPVLLYYDLPDEEGRLAYINYLLKKTPHSQELDKLEIRTLLARMSEGLAQANILYIFDDAFRRKSNETPKDAEIKITLEDVIESRDMLRHGIAKIPRLSLLNQSRRVAIHEGGHAAITWEVSGDKVILIHLSAKHRGASYGRVESMPVTPVDIRTQTDLEAWLRISLASYATERNIFGEPTTGVAGDLGMATLLATEMVEFWAMMPRDCSDADMEKYRKIGRKLVSWRRARSIAVQNHIEYSPFIRDIFGEEEFLNPEFGEKFIESLSDDKKAEIQILLGQAYVFDDIFVKLNRNVIEDVAKRLEEEDWEIRGEKLLRLYNELKEGGALEVKHVLAPPSSDADWPVLETKDPFYRGNR